jgi:hypothetical protein
MDYGAVAMTNTLNHLNDYGILHTGAGLGLQQAVTPIVIVTNGIRLGILAFGDIYPISLYSRGENEPGIAGIFSDRSSRPFGNFGRVSISSSSRFTPGVEYDGRPDARAESLRAPFHRQRSGPRSHAPPARPSRASKNTRTG